MRNKLNLRLVGRVAVTLSAVAVATALAWRMWQHYRYSPWTRDARIQANVIDIAPEVSGTVISLNVHENERVKKGQVLFQIDPRHYRHALSRAKAQVQSDRESMRLAESEAARRRHLGRDAISREQLQQANTKASEARANYQAAQARLKEARLNLKRTTLTAPRDGYVTHLLLSQGDFAKRGQSAITLVDSHSFHVVAYFKETKLAKLRIGEPVTVKLMAGWPAMKGHITSISHGIAVNNNNSGERNLAQVSPTFQWVRLAQRVPVRIQLDHVPANVHLSVGMTCTVTAHPQHTQGVHRHG